MNNEIQKRTTAVTDQIAKIQQQLESTLTQLEGRRSVTLERSRRLSSSSSVGSHRFDAASSVGHHNAVASSVGHGDAVYDYRPSEEVETMNGERSAVPRRQRTASSTNHASTQRSNQLARPAPVLTPKSPARGQRESLVSSTAPHTDNSSLEANGHATSSPPSEPQPAEATKDAALVATAATAGAAAAIVGAAASPAALGNGKQEVAPVEVEAVGDRSKELPDVPADSSSVDVDPSKPDESDAADEDDGDALNMFDEPDDFRPKTPPATVTYYEFPGTSSKVTLNLVGVIRCGATWRGTLVSSWRTSSARTLSRSPRASGCSSWVLQQVAEYRMQLGVGIARGRNRLPRQGADRQPHAQHCRELSRRSQPTAGSGRDVCRGLYLGSGCNTAAGKGGWQV